MVKRYQGFLVRGEAKRQGCDMVMLGGTRMDERDQVVKGKGRRIK